MGIRVGLRPRQFCKRLADIDMRQPKCGGLAALLLPLTWLDEMTWEMMVIDSSIRVLEAVDL
jgi:hypothetical protein